ncbi:hypothetical protein MHBO_003577 [Bonamia ostreae]|uniref:Fibrinogen C-terminal domain-containing protein n=1 Tax=Bonamia ostreae TaxID=126728 RepID=A0ABV2AR86_9EUKA
MDLYPGGWTVFVFFFCDWSFQLFTFSVRVRESLILNKLLLQVIQTRLRKNGVDFNRTWEEYKNGFGSVHTDYWIGNDVIHQLTTAHHNMLYMRIQDIKGAHYEEQYSDFKIADQSHNYTLTVSAGNGTAGQ